MDEPVKTKGRFLDEPSIDERSRQFGSITKTPTTIEKVGQRLTSPRTRPLGVTGGLGIALSALGIPEEDILPAVGQGFGGMATGFTGAGLLGATGGAVTGQSLRQLIKKSRGEKPSMQQVGTEALTTGLIEGSTRGAGKFIFRRQLGNELLGTLSKKLAGMKQAVSANKSLSIPSEDIYIPLKEAVEEVAVPYGPQSGIINKWLKFMEKNPKLTSKNLIELESDLGEVSKYGEIQKGAFVSPSGVKKPSLNTISKTSRKQVSDIVDTMAEESGQKGFKKLSSRIHKLLMNPDKTDITKASGGFGSRIVAAGAVGGATQSPLIGAATYLGLKALQSPELRNLLFKGIKSVPGSVSTTGAKLALSELVRKK